MSEMRFEPDEIRARAYRIRRLASMLAVNRTFTNMGIATGDVPDAVKTLGNQLMTLGTTMSELYSKTADLLCEAAAKLETTDETIGENY